MPVSPYHSSDMDPTIAAIDRPHSNLLRYYCLLSMLLGPLFPLLLAPKVLKYRTLRYEFDRQGVTMAWGALFRREVRLNYSRLQDIHLQSNVVERWLGLARVELQTASGSAKPEMVLEGIPQYEQVRDFLYQRMHGEEDRDSVETDAGDPLLEALTAVADELAAIRQLLASGATSDQDLP